MLLLDANALSEVVRKRPNPVFLDHLERSRNELLATASICVFELRYGCSKRGGDELWKRIGEAVLSRVTVLPFGPREAVIAGDLFGHLETSGQPIGLEDVLIGATALANDAAVVTRNTRHLSRVPRLHVIDWWR